jgi:hypothetical protein
MFDKAGKKKENPQTKMPTPTDVEVGIFCFSELKGQLYPPVN